MVHTHLLGALQMIIIVYRPSTLKFLAEVHIYVARSMFIRKYFKKATGIEDGISWTCLQEEGKTIYP